MRRYTFLHLRNSINGNNAKVRLGEGLCAPAWLMTFLATHIVACTEHTLPARCIFLYIY